MYLREREMTGPPTTVKGTNNSSARRTHTKLYYFFKEYFTTKQFENNRQIHTHIIKKSSFNKMQEMMMREGRSVTDRFF